MTIHEMRHCNVQNLIQMTSSIEVFSSQYDVERVLILSMVIDNYWHGLNAMKVRCIAIRWILTYFLSSGLLSTRNDIDSTVKYREIRAASSFLDGFYFLPRNWRSIISIWPVDRENGFLLEDLEIAWCLRVFIDDQRFDLIQLAIPP